MKICLPIDKRVSLLGHAIARLLDEKYEVEEFYDFACLRKDNEFLKFQKDIRYSPLFVKEDLKNKARDEKLVLVYLKFLEKEYGLPNLWPYLTIDRYFMMSHPRYEYSYSRPACNYTEMLKHLQVKFREISKALKEKKPDVIIFITVGGMERYILYQVAKKMGIKTVIIEFTRVKDGIILVDNCYNVFSNVNKLFDSLRQGTYLSSCRNKAIAFLKEFREEVSSSQLLQPLPHFSFFQKLVRVACYFWKTDHLIYLQNHLIRALRKLRGFRDLFEEPKNEDFAFFPLHLEPELATMLLAPFYVNQIALIQNIARSLPVHFKLYVKEHPHMLYYRPRSYYKELKKIPNVRLINAEVSSVSLIRKAKIVLTITGSVGWEAVLLQKPVITFGSVFYNKLSMVRHSDNIENLPFLIKECLENYHHNEEELIDFLSAIFEYSTSLDINYLWQKTSLEEIIEDEKLKKFVDFLAEELNLKPVRSGPSQA